MNDDVGREGRGPCDSAERQPWLRPDGGDGASHPEPHVDEPHVDDPHVGEPQVDQPHVGQPLAGEAQGDRPHVGEPHGEGAHVEGPHGEGPHGEGPHGHGPHGDQVEEAPAEPRHGALSMLGTAGKELIIVVGMALVLSFVVKTWLLQAFYIPSGSMEDTLVLNDRVIVSKLTPGPFELKRGDIVVFADPDNWLEAVPKTEHGPAVDAIRNGLMFVGLLPDDAENHLIKRVIGLPGDHVVCCDEGERLTVNGTPLVEPYLKPGDAPSSQEFDIRVPAGSVWVMGDHRSDSADSRFHDPSGTGQDGSVPESLVVGRAVALVWPLDHLKWLSNPRATFAKVPAPASGG